MKQEKDFDVNEKYSLFESEKWYPFSQKGAMILSLILKDFNQS